MDPNQRITIDDCVLHAAFETERLMTRNQAPSSSQLHKLRKHSRAASSLLLERRPSPDDTHGA